MKEVWKTNFDRQHHMPRPFLWQGIKKEGKVNWFSIYITFVALSYSENPDSRSSVNPESIPLHVQPKVLLWNTNTVQYSKNILSCIHIYMYSNQNTI